MEKKNLEELLSLARDIASSKTDEGLNKATEILLYAINKGCEDPEVLVTTADFLLQSPRAAETGIEIEAIKLVDKALEFESDKVSVLEEAIACYELTLSDFPGQLDKIIKVCYRILNLNPDHVESMLILANQRGRPGVTLTLEDTIGMLEWAQELAPANMFVAFTLARVYLEAGRFTEAKSLFARISSTSPDSKGTTLILTSLIPSISARI